MKSYVVNPKSSRVFNMEYDSETQELIVNFRRGGTYKYYDVPWQVWEDLKSSPSLGKAINSLIKPVYRYDRIA